MKKRYVNWVNGLEWDWSVSRNRHFGIPIPVWECPKCGQIIIAEEKELPVDPLVTKKKCPKCKLEAIPEKMVLDTWATSSMSPKIASNLSGNKINLPFALRPQAHDIIRTWAFYTIVRAYLHEGKIPWKSIVISGNVSMGGEKMSKSKGNVIDPKKVLEEYGADAMRFWAAGSKLGMDLDYQEKDLLSGKKMINKLLNASKFVFMNLKNYDGKKKPKKLEYLDELFLNQLNFLIKSVSESFENYEYSKAKQEVEEFFWHDFCDNYLEIVKKRVYQGEGDRKLSAQFTLYSSLLIINKLLAPIMPFISEEIYQENFRMNEKEKSIHSSKWPSFYETKDKENFWDDLLEILSSVRQEKSKNQKPMNAECEIFLTKDQLKFVNSVEEDFRDVTNSKNIKEAKEFNVNFL
jgi:valyl-tRNA synthetase